MPIFRSHRVAFIHIPKCGGTSIEVALGWAKRYPTIGLEPTQTDPDYDHLFGGGLQHLTAKELRLLHLGVEYATYYTFAVIRNPIDRFLSHFLWKHYRFKKVDCSTDELAIKLTSFADYVWNLYKASGVFRRPRAGYVAEDWSENDNFPANDVRRHLLPQCAYLHADDELIVDQLFCIRKLAALLRGMHPRLEIHTTIEKRMAAQDTFNPMTLLSRDAIDKLYDLYRDDVDLYTRVVDSGGVWPNSSDELHISE